MLKKDTKKAPSTPTRGTTAVEPLLVAAPGADVPIKPVLVAAPGADAPVEPVPVAAPGADAPVEPLLLAAPGTDAALSWAAKTMLAKVAAMRMAKEIFLRSMVDYNKRLITKEFCVCVCV